MLCPVELSMLPGKLTFLLNRVSDCGLLQHPESPGSWEVLLCFLAGLLRCFGLCEFGNTFK